MELLCNWNYKTAESLFSSIKKIKLLTHWFLKHSMLYYLLDTWNFRHGKKEIGRRKTDRHSHRKTNAKFQFNLHICIRFIIGSIYIKQKKGDVVF